MFDKDTGKDDFLGKFDFDIADFMITNKGLHLQKCKSGDIMISKCF